MRSLRFPVEILKLKTTSLSESINFDNIKYMNRNLDSTVFQSRESKIINKYRVAYTNYNDRR